MQFDFAGRTDVGRVRSRNEDALLERPERGLFAVADGMGGHAAGDIASRIAVDVLDERTASGAVADALPEALRAAHEAILKAAHADPELEGMGTTLTVLHVDPAAGRLALAHVGDSRAYRLRNGAMEQLTRDQTWVQDQVDAGLLSPEQARHHPFSAMITCALGIDATELDIQTLDPDGRAGDTFLLCSDGLVARLDDDEIRALVVGNEDLEDAAAALVDAANEAGGPDNITVALVRLR